MSGLKTAEMLGGLAAVFALYLAGVRRAYRLKGLRPTERLVPTGDGGVLAVHHRPAAGRRFLEPVLLCHGIATNHRNLDFDPPYSLAHALANAGFECFSVDWRGTGRSRPPPSRRRFDYCVDDHIRWDGPALLDHALTLSGASRAFWLGHSMGGLIGYGVAQGPSGARLGGILALGSPVFFEYTPWLRTLVGWGASLPWPSALRQKLLSVALAPFLGYVTLPLSDTIVNPKNIPPRVQRKVYAEIMEAVSVRLLRQFKDWIVHDVFRSEDQRTDYRAGLGTLRLPALVMGGSQDRLASAKAVQAQFDLLGSQDKTMMVFGKDNGDAEDYGHGDLLFGAQASKEIYPRIIRWLAERATPTS